MSARERRASAERERDLAFMKRAQKGDAQAFEQLIITHQASLRQFCYLLLRNEAEADDAAQEVFFKAYRKSKQFNGKGSVKSWLLGIAANHCKDMLRAGKHNPVLIDDEVLAHLQQSGAFSDEEERISQRQLANAALQQVKSQYRTVLLLREVAGYEYTEIAKLLSCSLDAVKARLRRAREEFGSALHAKQNEQPAAARDCDL